MEAESVEGTDTPARDQAETEKGGISRKAENQRREVRPCGGSEEKQEEAYQEEAQAKRQQERIHTRTPEWEEKGFETYDKRKKTYEAWKEKKKRDGRVEKEENGSEERETARETERSGEKPSDGDANEMKKTAEVYEGSKQETAGVYEGSRQRTAGVYEGRRVWSVESSRNSQRPSDGERVAEKEARGQADGRDADSEEKIRRERRISECRGIKASSSVLVKSA